MGKAEHNKQTKRASLLQAAFDLFVNKGFHQTTISEISKASGLAKGTFYLYFKDKYDLRDQLVARKSGQLLQEATEELFSFCLLSRAQGQAWSGGSTSLLRTDSCRDSPG